MKFADSVTLPFILCLLAVIIKASAVCNQVERDALLKFKLELTDPSNLLSSWEAAVDFDCCRWYGVICDNITGHVTELHLDILPPYEYFNEAYLERTAIGGNLGESLLDLKHLKFLDLSNNDFGGIEIPEFLGSMESLRYLNLSSAGFGGRIPPHLGNLTGLKYLDISNRAYLTRYDMYAASLHWLSSLRSLEFLDLSRVNLTAAFNWLDSLNTLPSLVELHLSGSQIDPTPALPDVSFSSLATLNLSQNNFPNVPSWVFHLKTLSSLDLSGNRFVEPIPIHLQNITTLRELRLSNCYVNSSIFDLLLGFKKLQHLQLASNYKLQGTIPSSIGNFTSLISLDLSGCSFEGEIPGFIGKLTFLKSLDLSSNRLQGKIPSAIANLTSLSILDLSGNNLEGEIPAGFKALCNLTSLRLSKNKLSQEINEVIEILSVCGADMLESLILSSTQLSGSLSDHLGKFKNLVYLDLSDNLISGPIPENLGQLNFLINLNLGNNKLNGSLPVDFRLLAKLKGVDISGNSLEGEILEIHLANLTNLETFKASGNRLALKVSPDWIPPFQYLTTLSLNYWKVGPRFPSWIKYLKYLLYLELSNSDISSTLPIWFGNFSSKFYQINLSHNQMHGSIPYLSIDDSDYSLIDLSSNSFEGPMPSITANPSSLDLSNNSFSGSISSFLCNQTRSIEVLNLGENLFSGEISDCWMNWSSVSVIRLSNNRFSGNIPKSIGYLGGDSYFSLGILNLRNNSLSGEIPDSLKNCTGLKVLDLSSNELGGKIPTWMWKFQQTSILNLRGNEFCGVIPMEICSMNNLQILDFAENNLNGTIPRCLNNLTEMISGTSVLDYGTISSAYGPSWTYSESSSIVRNGRIYEYSTILNYVRSLDLSENKLSGEIPEEITSLKSLQALNLSHNHLVGRVPKNIGSMTKLQSLDLSRNRLSGEIPNSLARLTFLSNLNLSNNNLSGIIPSSTQLQSLDPSSFGGNDLCGPPLTRKCRRDDTEPDIDKGAVEGEEDGDGLVDWFSFCVSMLPGFVIGFWAVMGSLLYNRKWRNFYFKE